MIKFLIVGDLHGAIPKIRTRDFDAIIAPGDLCGDDIRPYVKKWIVARTKLKKGALLDFTQFCSKKKQRELYKSSIKKGREVLKHLNSFDKPVFLVPGNWDPKTIQDGRRDEIVKEGDWEKLKKGLKNIVDVEHNKITFKNIDIIGHGSTSAPEPLVKLPRKIFESREDFEDHNIRVKFFIKVMKKLESYFKKSKLPTILISHDVPLDSKIDKVNAPGTYAHKKHYGSRIARELIVEFQPLLCVGGHIHEGYGKVKIRKTQCINAGFGPSVNTIIDIDEKKGKIIEIKFLGKNKVN